MQRMNSQYQTKEVILNNRSNIQRAVLIRPKENVLKMQKSYYKTKVLSETSPEGVLTYFLTKYLLSPSSIWLHFGQESSNLLDLIIMCRERRYR